ncbi:MAG: AAA family ATPase [Phycisphaerales bacterium]|nr:MAG: AAA family ATPase [Phycisphaerales bacterium]
MPEIHGAKIAIGGKGGVGKTTVSAILAQLFAETGYDVLAIDADPDVNLASAFGLPYEQSPQPLIKMKELIAERTGTGKDTLGAYFKLNPKVSDVPQEYWIEVKGLKLLVLGAITQAGAGCACPEGAFLKALLTHTILQRQEVVMVDLAAGVEFMGRASVQGIDALVLVVEPGARSIETAKNMAQMARKLGIRCVGAVANKIVEPAQTEVIESQLHDTVLLGSIGYSRALQEADLNRASVFEADPEVTEELRRAKDRLTELIARPKTTTEIQNVISINENA